MKANWSDAWEAIPAEAVSPHQREAIRLALAGKIGILNGSPGTGKTFVSAQIVKYLSCRFGLESIACCCPTGKAAVRLTSAMLSYGLDVEATTMHRLLRIGRNGHDGGGWQFQMNEGSPLPFKFLIVDEVSMVDADLMAAFLSACAPGTHVLFVGDSGQLPPVGHGAPFRDLIESGAVPIGTLSEIRRNSGLIVEACREIKHGRPVTTADQVDDVNNLKHVHGDTADEQTAALKAILSRFQSTGKFNAVWDCQVLCATNDKRRELNRILQALLNEAGEQCKPNPFRIGDKVICLKNSSMPLVDLVLGKPGNTVDSWHPSSRGEEFLANGEIGKVLAVGPKLTIARFDQPPRTIKIVMGKPKEAEGDAKEDGETAGTGCDFDLAYSITTHKSQGSEWPCCIVIIEDTPGAKRVCSREHVYTAISRAKKLCVLVGKMGVLEAFCRKVSLDKRKTFLKELVNGRRGPKPKEFDVKLPDPSAQVLENEPEPSPPPPTLTSAAIPSPHSADIALADIDIPPYVRHRLAKAGIHTVGEIDSDTANLSRFIYDVAHVNWDAAEWTAQRIKEALSKESLVLAEVPDDF